MAICGASKHGMKRGMVVPEWGDQNNGRAAYDSWIDDS